jgi:hypothetical protein
MLQCSAAPAHSEWQPQLNTNAQKLMNQTEVIAAAPTKIAAFANPPERNRIAMLTVS